MTRVHLDTDIGGDIDDVCALALLLRWPGADLAAITTSAEDGGRRAGYARYVLNLAGRDDVPVAAGIDVGSGRFRYVPGFPDEAQFWPEPVAPLPGPSAEALRLLQRSIVEGAVIVAIGPFTNLAALEGAHPGILREARLFLMGGYVRPIREGYPAWKNRDDYNVQLDVAASRCVIESAHPTLVPLTITAETALRRAYLPALRAAGALGELLARQTEAHAALWVEQGEQPDQPATAAPRLPADIINAQHDPLAVAVALGWNGVTIETLPLALREEGGWLLEEERPGGRPTAVVTAVEGERFNRLWLETVTRT
jgi:purine nucleosidase